MNRLSRTSCRELGRWRGNSSCLFELPSPFPREGGRASAMLSFLTFKLTVTWKTALSISVLSRTLQLNNTKHCLHTEPEETRCRGTASQHPEVVKQTSTKPYKYTSIEHDKIKLAFRLRDANNSKFREPKRNRQVPRLFFPFEKSGMRDYGQDLSCDSLRPLIVAREGSGPRETRQPPHCWSFQP